MGRPAGRPSPSKVWYLKVAVSISILTSIVSFAYLQKINTSIPMKLDCRGTPVTSTITPLGDNRTFIIAAYADKRELTNNVRMIAIVHHQDVQRLYCWFCCPSLNKNYVSRALIDVHEDRFEFSYGATDVCCVEPKGCAPDYVSVHWSHHGEIKQMPRFEIQNRDTKGLQREFTVCISTMYGEFNNVLQLVQSIEMYKILGAKKVVIYKNSCSQLTEKVLDFYVTEGTVEIVPWPIHSYLSVSRHWHHKWDTNKDIGYYGQITALNDCLYRNMYKSKYVLLNDIDEIILPVKYPDWRTMMWNLQVQNPHIGVFLFENHIFPRHVFMPDEPFNFLSWSTVPGTNILRHIMKEPWTQPVFNQQKMIVDPRKVIQTSVHHVLKSYGTFVYVKSDVGFSYHCRAPHLENLPRESMIKDPTLWRYNKSLIENVNRVLQHTVLGAKETEGVKHRLFKPQHS